MWINRSNRSENSKKNNKLNETQFTNLEPIVEISGEKKHHIPGYKFQLQNVDDSPLYIVTKESEAFQKC